MPEYNVYKSSLKSFALDILYFLQGRETPVFLCVGSDRVVCDSLGPMVGEILIKKYNVGTYVYGNLEYNINANNLTNAINYIETEHPYSPIILIDATLGGNAGDINISNGCYAGMGKILPIRKMGDISILGVVGSKCSKFNLNTTNLKIVCDMADFVSKGIAMAMSVYLQAKKNRIRNLARAK